MLVLAAWCRYDIKCQLEREGEKGVDSESESEEEEGEYEGELERALTVILNFNTGGVQTDGMQ